MAISNDSFLGLERLEFLDVSKLPLQSFLVSLLKTEQCIRAETPLFVLFQSGAFASLRALRELSITTQPLLQLINIGNAVASAPSMQSLQLEVLCDRKSLLT